MIADLAAFGAAATLAVVLATRTPRRIAPLPPPRSGEEHAHPLFLPEPHTRAAAERWAERNGRERPRWSLRTRLHRRITTAARRGVETVELRGGELAEALRTPELADLTDVREAQQ